VQLSGVSAKFVVLDMFADFSEECDEVLCLLFERARFSDTSSLRLELTFTLFKGRSCIEKARQKEDTFCNSSSRF
jgi:hypothetical protein